MKPFFCRVGSKRTMVNRVLKLIPEHTTYVEPFVGGGAVYFAKEPSHREVINDLDTELIRAYRLLATLKDHNFPTNLNTLGKIQRFYDNAPNTKPNKLVKYILRSCNGFGSIPGDVFYHKSNPYSKLKHIDYYQERMKDTKILNESYEKVIKRYDSPTTFFYLDPPYENSEGLYDEHAMDFVAMRSLLDKVKGYWLVSINDSPYIRKVFAGYKIRGFTLKGVGNKGIGNKPRKELLISNYT
jgi:DNA adenine methylase